MQIKHGVFIECYNEDLFQTHELKLPGTSLCNVLNRFTHLYVRTFSHLRAWFEVTGLPVEPLRVKEIEFYTLYLKYVDDWDE